MATEIIRPDGTSSSTGFDLSGAELAGAISDNDTDTKITQSNEEANFIVTFGNLSVSGVTINSITVTVSAQSSGRAAEANMSLAINLGGNINLMSLAFESDLTSQVSSERTTAADGAQISEANISDLTATITAGTEGIAIAEIFATVDYSVVVPVLTYDDSAHHVDLTSGHIDISSGNIFI